MIGPRLVLRTIAVVIAMLGWLDPPYAGRSRPRIAVLDEVRPASAAVSPLAEHVAAQLAGGALVTTHADPDADAWVVVAEDEEAEIPRPPDGVGLSLVTPPAPAASIVVESVDAPRRTVPGQRAPVVATFAARGLRGADSTFVVRSGSLPLAWQTHRWTKDDERLTAPFDVPLPSAGVNHLIVEAVDGPGRSRRSRADTAIAADDATIVVLVYEGRPSWTTTFARRVLERDSRFRVAAVARLSRNVSASFDPRVISPIPGIPQTTRPISLSEALLGAPTVALVGAPETLSGADVEALRTFVTGGGVAVLAPDQRPAGAYRPLLLGTSLNERLLEDPARLPLPEAPDLALLASELIESTALPAGADVVAPGSRPASASIWTAPLGRGRVLFVGALDAWRFRGQKGEAFDRWWPQVVEWLGRERRDDEEAHGDPRVATPGERVAISVRRRQHDETGTAIRATIEAAAEPVGRREKAPLRLWPTAEAGGFAGVINAPQRPGVYAVSTTSGPIDSHRTQVSHAPLIVDADARRARQSDDRWTIATASRGGVVATSAEIDRVRRAVTMRADRAAHADRVFPMRSLWWLLPFTACLGGDWLLRRRAGLR